MCDYLYVTRESSTRRRPGEDFFPGRSFKRGERMNFKADGYVKSTRMDQEGQKLVTLVFDASAALDVARLELMSRDPEDGLPTLLTITAELKNGEVTKAKSKRKSASPGVSTPEV